MWVTMRRGWEGERAGCGPQLWSLQLCLPGTRKMTLTSQRWVTRDAQAVEGSLMLKTDLFQGRCSVGPEDLL